MLETVFRSADLPEAQRFERWRESLSRALTPLHVSRDHTVDFAVYQRELHFEGLRVWIMTLQPMVFHRTAKLIQQSDPETYNVCLLMSGAMGRSSGRHGEATYGPYELHANDSSQPFDLRAMGTRGATSCVGIEIPKKRLALPRDKADQLIGRPVSARNGIGALLGSSLIQLAADTSAYRAADDPRLASILGGLVSAVFAHVIDEDDRGVSPETHRRTLTLRIQRFIRQHLHDPQLTRDTIAAAHHISTSYLHRLFQDEGMSVMAWVRHQRLERARADLADPAQYAVPVHAIAARWGFTGHTDFTRAFRSAYGNPPREYRQQALRALPTEPYPGATDDAAFGAAEGPRSPALARHRSEWLTGVVLREGAVTSAGTPEEISRRGSFAECVRGSDDRDSRLPGSAQRRARPLHGTSLSVTRRAGDPLEPR